jgi:hypothetical protein
VVSGSTHQSNIDNLNNVRSEASRHFRNKKREYMKTIFNKLETNSMNKNTRLVEGHQLL